MLLYIKFSEGLTKANIIFCGLLCTLLSRIIYLCTPCASFRVFLYPTDKEIILEYQYRRSVQHNQTLELNISPRNSQNASVKGKQA